MILKKPSTFLLAALLLLIGIGYLASQKWRTSASKIALKIVEAEDLRRWDGAMAALLNDANAAVRRRAALAAGRIGDESAVAGLRRLLGSDIDEGVAETAAFALGEIESASAADSLMNAVLSSKSNAVRARSLEALGKIAASLPEAKPPQAKPDDKKRIGGAIVVALGEQARGQASDRQLTLLGLTAALRAKPDGGPEVTALFLDSTDPRIRADALNVLARVRAKQSLDRIRTLLTTDADPIVRANAARALGAAEDAASSDALVLASAMDPDSRVRVGAIRALASIKKPENAPALLRRGQELLSVYAKAKGSSDTKPAEINEVREIATALGTLLGNVNHKGATAFLLQLRTEGIGGPEVEIAYARISPAPYLHDPSVMNPGPDWQRVSSIAQALSDLATLKDTGLRSTAEAAVRSLLENPATPALAVPDLLHAFHAFKSKDLADIARKHLKADDVIIRAAAAEILSDLPPSEDNSRALADALPSALEEKVDDAARSIVGALAKAQDSVAKAALTLAAQKGGYVVRREASAILKTAPGLANTRNTTSDYKRAVGRIGKSVKAVIATEKGTITIQLLPDEAPLTVDSFVSLARAHFFDNLTFHRVVPNFVIQGGDPRADGNGGPGYAIRCEINMVPFERGAVGMALSGKDTGGSQFFVTHSPQPHLDGGYTVFGRVVDGMNVVDSVTRGDRILSIEIIEE